MTAGVEGDAAGLVHADDAAVVILLLSGARLHDADCLLCGDSSWAKLLQSELGRPHMLSHLHISS